MYPVDRNLGAAVGTCTMAKRSVPGELWTIIFALLPPEPPKPGGGTPRVPDRAALAGIIHVLKSGIPWGVCSRRDRASAGGDVLEAPRGLAEGRGEAAGAPRGAGTRSEADRLSARLSLTDRRLIREWG